jgi:nucleoside-diphosphate-sugar epimerase
MRGNVSKVLVTGAGGFIGSHLVEQLAANVAEVRAFVEYDSRGSWGWLDDATPETLDAIEIIAGDIRDSHAVRQAVAGCDTVLHLAALIGIPYSYLAPESYVDTNVTGTLNVVQAATDLGASHVARTSTSEVYGTARTIADLMDVEIEIETEDTRLRPDAAEVERLWCDNSKAAAMIDWQPAHAEREGFRRGLAATVDWFARPTNRAGCKAHIYNV